MSSIVRFDEYIKENTMNGFIVLYHGTMKKYVDSILKNGLVTTQHQSDWYMLSTDIESAIYHSKPTDINEKSYVVEFKIPIKNNNFWLGYPYLWDGYYRNDKSTWYAIKQSIPSEFITQVHEIEYGKWLDVKNTGY